MKHILALPDMHVPYEDKRTMRAVEQLMADGPAPKTHWDEIVQIGDFLSLDCISHHNKNSIRDIVRTDLASDFRAANVILDRWQRIAPKSKIVLLEGNHEDRVRRWVDELPQLANLLDVPIQLRLKERGIKWVPYQTKDILHTVGSVNFGHGRYTNKYHAFRHADDYGCNLFYGHTHDVQSFSKVRKGKHKLLMAQSMGCLCDKQKYMQGRPDNWQQAIGVFHLFPNGHFTPNIIQILGHRFWYNGKVYKG